MPITAPTTAVEGTTGLIITGTSLSTTDPVYVVASDGVNEYLIEQTVNGRGTGSINIDLDCGLAKKISGDITAFSGVPLTDSNWSLKWRVGVDELAVTITPPANYQQREVANSEKLGGFLDGFTFGEKDQEHGLIDTATNTVKHLVTNTKASGFFEGVNRVMSETTPTYIWTQKDAKWRKRNVVVLTKSGNEFTSEFTGEFS